MTEEPFRIELATGLIGGWTRSGDPGRRVLLLHGGPGLNDYMAWLADDLDGWTCASFQQRGIAPSTTNGPFDIDTAVDDVAAVLDHLAAEGWQRPLVAGHSWGGHLAWHIAVRLADRVRGVLAIDPLGAVGDMGESEFQAELVRRAPAQAAALLENLEAREAAGTLTADDHVDALAMLWPGYFADATAAPRMPETVINPDTGEQMMASALAAQPGLERALPAVTVPLGAIVGGRSPMPNTAASDTTERVPGGWTEVVADAGHFLWHEAPGAVGAALERLAGRSA